MHETIHFGILVRDELFDTIFKEIGAFQYLTHMGLSGSMAVTLEIPQCVVYQKNVVYTFVRSFVRSFIHSFIHSKLFFISKILLNPQLQHNINNNRKAINDEE